MVVVPIGFVSDHMEVIYDLDTEASATAEKLGIDVRAGRDRRARPAVRVDGARPAVERAAAERGARRDARHRSARRRRRGTSARRAAAPTRGRRARRCAAGTEVTDGAAPYDDLLELAVEVAPRGRRPGPRRRAAGSRSPTTKSSPTDIVTEVDQAAEGLIRERLTRRPARRRLPRGGGGDAPVDQRRRAGSSTRSTAP